MSVVAVPTVGETGTAQERCLPTGDEPGAIYICWGCPEAELLQPGHVTSTVMFMGHLLTKSSSLPISLPFLPRAQRCDLVFLLPPRLQVPAPPRSRLTPSFRLPPQSLTDSVTMVSFIS